MNSVFEQILEKIRTGDLALAARMYADLMGINVEDAAKIINSIKKYYFS